MPVNHTIDIIERKDGLEMIIPSVWCVLVLDTWDFEFFLHEVTLCDDLITFSNEPILMKI